MGAGRAQTRHARRSRHARHDRRSETQRPASDLLDGESSRSHASSRLSRCRRHHERLPRPAKRCSTKGVVQCDTLPKIDTSSLTLNSSARASGASPSDESVARVAAGSEIFRRLFTSVFRFCAKDSFTNSRNFSSSALSIFVFYPGNRMLTKGEPTSGGGGNASRGISSTICGHQKY